MTDSVVRERRGRFESMPALGVEVERLGAQGRELTVKQLHERLELSAAERLAKQRGAIGHGSQDPGHVFFERTQRAPSAVSQDLGQLGCHFGEVSEHIGP